MPLLYYIFIDVSMADTAYPVWGIVYRIAPNLQNWILRAFIDDNEYMLDAENQVLFPDYAISIF